MEKGYWKKGVKRLPIYTKNVIFYIPIMFRFAFIAFFAVLFLGCGEYESKVVLGHDWNPTAKVVVDTTSVFKPNDIIVIEMDNGNKPFKAVEVELRIYQGESEHIMFKRAIAVKGTDAKAFLKGPNSEPLLARKILKTSTPGTYRVAFFIGDSMIAQKKMELVK